MAVQTILDIALLMEGGQSVVDTIRSVSPVWDKIPFKTGVKGKEKVKRLNTLPSTAFRSLGNDYSATKAEYKLVEFDNSILGGRAQIDRAELKLGGDIVQIIAKETNAKLKSAMISYLNYFFNGDISTDPEQFDGVKVLCGKLS